MSWQQIRSDCRKSIKPVLLVFIVMEFWRYFPENTPGYTGVRTNRYKYLEFERGHDPWLFDLALDPGEQHKLYATPAGEVVRDKLKALLDKLLEDRRL